MTKKRVLLTGASGSMGGEAFKELLRRKAKYDTVLLLRPSEQNKKAFTKYEGQEGVKIVWGDLCNFDDVLEAVNGADYVLHPAAFIAPEADRNPPLCKRINCGGTENIIAAIKKQPDNGNNVRFVYVGSVAEYGDRLPPIHMVKVGDLLKPSVGDFYATTKIAAERAVIESGLKYWAVMRQTYIAIPDAVSLLDPILFHQPVNTHIELITSEDAGYGLVQTIEAPDEFYGRVYNMSGGPSCRVVFKDYIEHMMKIFGLGDYQKIMPLNWFAQRNFHCCWFEDSWVLNEYLHHWRHSLEDHYKQVEAATPWYLKLGGRIAPSFIVKAYMKRMADPLKWIENDDVEKITAFFGSREKWESIPDWEHSVYAKHKQLIISTSSVKGREKGLGKYTIRGMQEFAESIGERITTSFSVKAYMKRMADPLKWIENNDVEKIKAPVSSREKWESIPDWEHSVYAKHKQLIISTSSVKGNGKEPSKYTIGDMQDLAESRGGQCLSPEFIDMKTKLRWRCSFGHEWEATPRLHKSGHWCPECAAPPWDYDIQAKLDPALAAVYYNNHDRKEYQKVDWLYCRNE